MTIRTLIVRLGFKGDITKLIEFDKKVTSLKTNILGLSAVFAAATVSLGYFLKEAAKLEQTKIAFEVMTGSIQMGQQLIKDLFKFARTTPFQIPGVLSASKILLAMGVETENQIETLTQLGHVAAGINKPLDQLASIFGRVKAAGYLTGYEMERLRRAGVPLGRYLSELLKRPETEILTMIRRKEISFEMFAEGWELMVEHRFPQLMDRLLQTFLGLVSNIKDYIYEIVAFSGENLLPVFRLMARQLLFLMESSRKLVAIKFQQFFSGVSRSLELLNKGFIKLYFRTRETIQQFGGLNRLFKIFMSLAGTFLSVKTLGLLGKIGKMGVSLFSMAALKAALLGLAMIGIAAAAEDIIGFLYGKKSLTGDILNFLEDRFPNAFKHIEKWLKVLKKEVEGLSLMLFGLFEGLKTGDWSMLKAGAEQVSEAWQMAMKKVATGKVAPGAVGYPIDVTGMNIIEGTISQSPFLRKLAEKVERASDVVNEAFKPGGQALPTRRIGPSPTGRGLPEFNLPGFGGFIGRMRQFREYIEQPPQMPTFGFSRQDKASLVKDMKVNVPMSITFQNMPNNINKNEAIGIMKKTIQDVVHVELDKTFKKSWSAIAAEQD